MKEISAHRQAVEVTHLAATPGISLRDAPGKDSSKCLLMVTDLLPNGSGQVTVILVDAHALIAANNADSRQLLGIRHRQSAHADRVEQLKYCSVGPNAQTESEDCNDCEYGSFAQGSQRKAQILP